MTDNSSRDTVLTFTIDIIYGAILFIVVFGVAFGLSELIAFCAETCINSTSTAYISKGVKLLILFADALLIIAYTYAQTLKALSELKLICKGS